MSLCCTHCFYPIHEQLIDFIISHGEKGDCDFCITKDVDVIEPTEIAEFLLPIVDLYQNANNFMGMEDLKEYDSSQNTLSTKLSEDWNVFGVALTTVDGENDLLEAIFKGNDAVTQRLEQSVAIPLKYYGDDLQAYSSAKKDWEKFKTEITTINRFFPKSVLDLTVLERLLDFQAVTLPKESAWFRARRNNNQLIQGKPEKFDCARMMTPPPHKTQGSRANPIGIPYLYLASDQDTAIKEVRPFIGEFVEVAKVFPEQELFLVSLKRSYLPSPFLKDQNELIEFVKYSEFLNFLVDDISKPVVPRRSKLDYIPIQYIFEYIKTLEYDGVLYDSSLGDGLNLVIFSSNLMQCSETDLFQIVNISTTIDLRQI